MQIFLRDSQKIDLPWHTHKLLILFCYIDFALFRGLYLSVQEVYWHNLISVCVKYRSFALRVQGNHHSHIAIYIIWKKKSEWWRSITPHNMEYKNRSRLKFEYASNFRKSPSASWFRYCKWSNCQFVNRFEFHKKIE